jgi:transketolase
MFQRDIFIKTVMSAMNKDSDIYFLSADFGAPALDELRQKFPDNFIHCGISEQAMIDVATGLAIEGKKVFAYAMAPFISLRAIEQAKCGPGLMDLPICLLSVGVGLGYADAGPTHYANEDYACARAIVGTSVYTAADSQTTEQIALELIASPKFAYVRLDREELPDIGEMTLNDVKAGFRVFGESSSNKVGLVSHGFMLHRCLEIQKAHPEKFYCIDLIRSKSFPDSLNISAKALLVVDEQTPSGNLAACVFEGLSNKDTFLPIVSKCLPEKYIFDNGGRDKLLEENGLGLYDIREAGERLLN